MPGYNELPSISRRQPRVRHESFEWISAEGH